MNIIKKWWFWVLIGVVLVAFFFPKPSGSGGRPGVQPLPQTWNNKECFCLGFEKNLNEQVTDAGYFNICFGIPLACKCTESTLVREGEPIRTNEITC